MSVEGAPPLDAGGKLLQFRGRADTPDAAAPHAEAEPVFTGWHPGPFATTDTAVPEPGAQATDGQPEAPGQGRGTVVGLPHRLAAPVSWAPRILGVAGRAVRLRVLAAAGAAVLLGGGVGAAAYTGALPEPVQSLAHSAIGAPAPEAQAVVAGRSSAPDAAAGPRALAAAPPTTGTGAEGDTPAVYGLCKSFDRAIERGDDAETARAFRNLVRAAGSAGKVQAFCARAEAPAGRTR